MGVTTQRVARLRDCLCPGVVVSDVDSLSRKGDHQSLIEPFVFRHSKRNQHLFPFII